MHSLHIADIRTKIKALDESLHLLLRQPDADLSGAKWVTDGPDRDVEVLPLSQLPPRAGLASAAGQARLLHDLANIELQAMELGLRTLGEFPEAPTEFREELAKITRSEGEHLLLCLDGLEELGAKWGDWPVHLALWQAASCSQNLIDRILVVHRHLEGTGLDAGDSILRRLTGVSEKRVVLRTVEQIVREEVGHVEFGSRWYRQICRLEKVDPDEVFRTRMPNILAAIPRREKLALELRQRAGFSQDEIHVLERVFKENVESDSDAISKTMLHKSC